MIFPGIKVKQVGWQLNIQKTKILPLSSGLKKILKTTEIKKMQQ